MRSFRIEGRSPESELPSNTYARPPLPKGPRPGLWAALVRGEGPPRRHPLAAVIGQI